MKTKIQGHNQLDFLTENEVTHQSLAQAFSDAGMEANFYDEQDFCVHFEGQQFFVFVLKEPKVVFILWNAPFDDQSTLSQRYQFANTLNTQTPFVRFSVFSEIMLMVDHYITYEDGILCAQLPAALKLLKRLGVDDIQENVNEGVVVCGSSETEGADSGSSSVVSDATDVKVWQPEQVTIANIENLFKRADVEVWRQSDNDLCVKIRDVDVTISINEAIQYLRFGIACGFDENTTLEQRSQLIGDLNNYFMFASYTMTDEGSLSADYYFPYQQGLLPLQLMAMAVELMSSVTSAVGAMNENGTVIWVLQSTRENQ